MNTRQLEYFLAVARELNFTRAAESMYVSQTAVTQQIKTLEEQLGVKLFERTKRKVTLTAAGRVFQEEATAILNRIDKAVQRTKEVTSGFIGTLNVGFTLGIGNTQVSERIRSFYRHYPNIAMQFTNLSPAALVRQMREGKQDLALMPLFYEKYYEDFCIRKLARDRLMAVMPWDHMLAQNQFVTWRELQNEPLIIAATKDSELGEDRIILDHFTRRGYQPNVVGYDEDVETIMFMVSCHMGISVFPEYLAVPEGGKITAVPFGAWEDHMDLVAAWMPDNDNPSLERIIPFLEEHLADEDIDRNNMGPDEMVPEE